MLLFEAGKGERAISNTALHTIQTQGVPHITLNGADRLSSIHLRDPLYLRIELASYRFEPPEGCRHADGMLEAHKIRVARGDHHFDREHLTDAIEALVERAKRSLSADRWPGHPC